MILKCSKCGNDRELTSKSAYEAIRLGKTICRKCRPTKMKGSKYDAIVKKGMKFGQWEIIGDSVVANGAMIKSKCSCGVIRDIRVNKLLNGSTTQCRKCSKGVKSPHWRGIGKLPATTFTIIKLRAKERGIQFKVSKNYLWKLFEEQNEKCALSALLLNFDPKEGRNLGNSNGNASLNRIDSSKGYIEGNVQWVHKHINIMKNEYSTEYFLYLCKKIYDNNRIKLENIEISEPKNVGFSFRKGKSQTE
jgi:hypothetical protein